MRPSWEGRCDLVEERKRMIELLTAIVEAIAAFLKAIPALVEGAAYALGASVTLIAYLISPKFRRRKREEWTGNSTKKFFELGISGFCLVLIISLVTWMFWPRGRGAMTRETFWVENGETNEDARVRFASENIQGVMTNAVIAIKKGGTRKIVETRSVDELRTAIRENVTLVGGNDGAQADGVTNGIGRGRSGR